MPRRTYAPVVFGSVFAVSFVVTACLRYSGTMLNARQAAPVALPLVQKGDLTYTGAFRVPASAFAYSGTLMAYQLVRDSLYLGTDQRVAELTIPEVRIASTIAGLDRASFAQPPTDVLAGKRTTIDGGISNGVNLGGVLPFGASLIVTAYSYYDGSGTQSKSHFKTGTDFSNLGTVLGPAVVSTTLRNPGAGFVAGYMTDIPTQWQAALGGVALTGQCCIPIISRSSYGPSISVFNPADVGRVDPIPSIPLIAYPQAHPTLGTYGPDGNTSFYNGKMDMAGVVFPTGTSTVLFFGRRGTKFCYGTGTSDPALDHQPVPAYPSEHYCYDPTSSNKGNHGYPYEHFVVAYDANELVKVKNGQKKPWDVTPYAKWTFSLPFENETHDISAVAYDPATQRVFIAAGLQDGNSPLIHVFFVAAGSSPSGGSHLCY